ncbi:hypothetical protein TNCV_1943931 [Trichonephila clavipes]|nr:hypothetical protein TNCV_1943931 [Trichonephila clavipes]
MLSYLITFDCQIPPLRTFINLQKRKAHVETPLLSASLFQYITVDYSRFSCPNPLHTMLETLFPGGHPVHQVDNTPTHKSGGVQTWLHELDDDVDHQT